MVYLWWVVWMKVYIDCVETVSRVQPWISWQSAMWLDKSSSSSSLSAHEIKQATQHSDPLHCCCLLIFTMETWLELWSISLVDHPGFSNLHCKRNCIKKMWVLFWQSMVFTKMFFVSFICNFTYFLTLYKMYCTKLK